MGLHAQRTHAAVEARARPVTPRDRLVDACGEQQLGGDLARALGEPNLIPAHPRSAFAVATIPVHPLRVDGVAQTVPPLQLMHDPIATPAVVAVADGAAVEVDARSNDVDVILGMLDHDIGHVSESHPLQIGAADLAPSLLCQALALRQPQRAMVDGPADVRVQYAHQPELGRERARRFPDHVCAHDARVVVSQLRALLEHVVEHAPEAAADLRLLNHASPPVSDTSSAPTSARRSVRTSR